ncbi:hypothetical protein KIN20_017762 [Parelaphostrongylus tenuis]|uniref:Uncharacterized protein n=1 Tax=Parelaphostrongylus tenuis TaxID=148309 RepID=A0AAD5MIC4_PARTN|nr:hypothetical protein KIN20_017762 [Parelaphostrongylus tenuis]
MTGMEAAGSVKSVVFQAANVYKQVKCCIKSGKIENRLWNGRSGHLVYFGKHSGNPSPNSEPSMHKVTLEAQDQQMERPKHCQK